MEPANRITQAQPDFSRLHIFGAGGSGREVAWLARQAWGDTVAIQFMVDHPRHMKGAVNGFSVSLLSAVAPSTDARYLIALGEPTLRRTFAEACDRAGHRPTTLVHPRTEMSQWVSIGQGTVVGANCVVTCNVQIGMHVQINVSCSVSHDVVIGDYSTLSPGARICGNVHVGHRVFVGANACIINGEPDSPLTIGDGAVIAAGSCVTKNVPPRVLVAGVPAAIKRELVVDVGFPPA